MFCVRYTIGCPKWNVVHRYRPTSWSCMRCYRDKPFAHKSLSIGSGRQNIRMCIVYVCFIYIYIIFNIQKVLGRNYTLAPVPWRVLGRKSLLPLWRLWIRWGPFKAGGPCTLHNLHIAQQVATQLRWSMKTLYNNDINQNLDPHVWWKTFFV